MANPYQNVNAETKVEIRLNGASNGTKVTVDMDVTLKDLGVDTASAAAPEYPSQELAKIQLCDRLTSAERAAKTTDILAKYEAANRAYSAGGGTTIQDKIVKAVCTYVNANCQGFGTGNGKWTLSSGHLTVSPVERNGVTVISVQGAPTWG
jgi:hypothetical protein